MGTKLKTLTGSDRQQLELEQFMSEVEAFREDALSDGTVSGGRVTRLTFYKPNARIKVGVTGAACLVAYIARHDTFFDASTRGPSEPRNLGDTDRYMMPGKSTYKQVRDTKVEDMR
ncbi:hypothetical protein CLCR_09301 [Cladophialophora carrionii]|uniref:Uncharacterized protein n=1 Tax=Cladophialophora carrionii TaxID=86049 RepID=A0A1C1CU66_9EURO|nr:hypothetical protein CLCR_09301 [Cladophialophora carrionii]